MNLFFNVSRCFYEPTFILSWHVGLLWILFFSQVSSGHISWAPILIGISGWNPVGPLPLSQGHPAAEERSSGSAWNQGEAGSLLHIHLHVLSMKIQTQKSKNPAGTLVLKNYFKHFCISFLTFSKYSFSTFTIWKLFKLEVGTRSRKKSGELWGRSQFLVSNIFHVQYELRAILPELYMYWER